MPAEFMTLPKAPRFALLNATLPQIAVKGYEAAA